MQTLWFRKSFSLTAINKNIVRAVAIKASPVNNETTLKSWKEIPGPKSLPVIGPLLNFLPTGEFYGLKGIKLSETLFNKYGPIVRLDGTFGSPNMVMLFDANAVEHLVRVTSTRIGCSIGSVTVQIISYVNDMVLLCPAISAVLKMCDDYTVTHGLRYNVTKSELFIFKAVKKTPNVILRSENTWPIRPGFYSLEYYRKRHNKTYDPLRQTGLLSEHGQKWKEFRSKVNHIMLQPKTIKLYENVLAEVADDMVVRMKSNRDENNMIKKKLDVEMNLWALESIGVVALGTRLNCFDPNLTEDSAARKLIQNVHDFFIIAEKVDFGPSPWRYFSTPNFKKAMEIYKDQESLAKMFIDKAMAGMESKKNDRNNSEKPILQKLLEIDVEIALIMASDMMIAGVDTAANTALATFYLLAKNPEKQNKLREEVIKKQRPYLRACIKESMRMLPVVNGNVRTSTKEYNVNGYNIPKDVFVIFAHQLMSNMEEHYPNPDDYIPERWIAEKDDPLYHGNAHPFASNPFGYGVRMCIGRRIAELEMETFIAKVVENFEIGWTGGPLNISPNSLNYITGPFNFVFKDV